MFRVAALCTLLTAACVGNESYDFPDGLEPLEENTAGVPSVGEIAIESGKARPSWAHGRARYAASAGEVWLALNNPQTVVNTWATDEQEVTSNSDENYEFSFNVHYTVNDILTVEWEEAFRYGVVAGTPEEPELGMIRYQIVYGSDFIDLIEGSYQVIPVDAETTEVQMVQHVQALSGGHKDIVETFEHIHENLLNALP